MHSLIVNYDLLSCTDHWIIIFLMNVPVLLQASLAPLDSIDAT